MNKRKTAYEITNVMIKETAEAVRTRDFERFARHFSIPFIMETLVGKQYIQSVNEMRQHFEGVCAFREENAIVDTVRENISAEFCDTKTISLTHISHLYQAGGVVFDRPYPTYSIIKDVDGEWLTHYCQYAVGNKDTFTQALLKYLEKTPRNCAAFHESH